MIKNSLVLILKIKSELIKELFTFLSKEQILLLITYNKKLQKMMNISLYNYQKTFIYQNIITELKYFDKIKLLNYIKSTFHNFDKDNDLENLTRISYELSKEEQPINNNKNYLKEYKNLKENKNLILNLNQYNNLSNIKLNFNNITILEINGENKDINFNILDNKLKNLIELNLNSFSNILIPISLLLNLKILQLSTIDNINFCFSKKKEKENKIYLTNLDYLKINKVYSNNSAELLNIEFIFENLQKIEIIEEINEFTNFHFLEKNFGLKTIFEICDVCNNNNYDYQILYLNDFYYMKDIFINEKFFNNLISFKFYIYANFYWTSEHSYFKSEILMEKLKNNYIKYFFSFYEGNLNNKEHREINLIINSQKEKCYLNDIIKKCNLIESDFNIDLDYVEKIKISKYHLFDDDESEDEKINYVYPINLFNNVFKNNLILQEIYFEIYNEEIIPNFINCIKYFIFLRKLIIINCNINKKQLFLLLDNLYELKLFSELKLLNMNIKLSLKEKIKIKKLFKEIKINYKNNLLNLYKKN
jgi:hypothetical protein